MSTLFNFHGIFVQVPYIKISPKVIMGNRKLGKVFGGVIKLAKKHCPAILNWV